MKNKNKLQLSQKKTEGNDSSSILEETEKDSESSINNEFNIKSKDNIYLLNSSDFSSFDSEGNKEINKIIEKKSNFVKVK
jgi:hypothetical protein